VFDYFGDYHRRAAFWFDGNHQGGLEEIIRLEAHDNRPILLSSGRDPMMAPHWRLAVLMHHREDLLRQTVYLDAATLDVATVPPGALLRRSVAAPPVAPPVRAGELGLLSSVREPGAPPYYSVVER